MKKIISIVLLAASCSFASAQEQFAGLNLGLGLGYYGYIGGLPVPVLHANYEFDVANNFTLAPFISFYSYRRDYHWGNNDYIYRETVVPIGVKGTYYFDELFDAGDPWDFYLGASAGFAIVNSRWNDDFDGDMDIYSRPSPVYLDLHVGSEYHVSERIGLFLDLSSGVSTFGIAIH